MIFIYILVFVISCLLLTLSSSLLVGALLKIAKFLGWKEFVVGFLMMAVATSLPNLFIGIISAIDKVPELSFGDVMGANIFDLSLVVAISVFISRMGLSAKSRIVQGSAIFTVAIAILPIILALDGIISRSDGLILISAFIFYIFWIFSKRERFEKIYDGDGKISFKVFFKNFGIFLLSVLLMLVAAKGLVESSLFFVKTFNIPIGLVGMFIIGIGSSLPETFFTLQAAKKSQDWLLLGNLMGGIIIVATLVLGTVALIHPIEIINFSSYFIARIFLIIAAISFLIFIRTQEKIIKKEAVILILIYLAFIASVILFR
ncbi:MAG: hypothetical protein Q7R84_03265 [bacterium]|nr:hypothetical protein [bacterium]